MIDLQFEAATKYYDRYTILISELWENFIVHPRKRQLWNLVNPDHLANLWMRAIYGGKLSTIHKLQIQNIVDLALDNIIQLHFNTVLAGHTERNPIAWLYENDITANEKQVEKFLNTIIDPITGQLWISDYGLKPIEVIVCKLLTEQSAYKQLLKIYRILNVVHCRGDLSAFFINGGFKKIPVYPEETLLFEHKF